VAVPSIFPPNTDARVMGIKGEMFFMKHCKDKGLKSRFTKNRMQRWDVTVREMKVDVKTIRTNYPPKSNYNVDLSSAQASLDSDIYAFVFYNEKNNKFTIAGALPRDDYLRKAVLKREGETERDGSFTYACDTYIVKVSELKPIEEVIKTMVMP